MPGGLQCSMRWFPPPVNYPSQYDPGWWTRRKTANKSKSKSMYLFVFVITSNIMNRSLKNVLCGYKRAWLKEEEVIGIAQDHTLDTEVYWIFKGHVFNDCHYSKSNKQIFMKFFTSSILSLSHLFLWLNMYVVVSDNRRFSLVSSCLFIWGFMSLSTLYSSYHDG